MSHLSLPVLPPSGLAPPPLGVVKVRYRALWEVCTSRLPLPPSAGEVR